MVYVNQLCVGFCANQSCATRPSCCALFAFNLEHLLFKLVVVLIIQKIKTSFNNPSHHTFPLFLQKVVISLQWRRATLSFLDSTLHDNIVCLFPYTLFRGGGGYAQILHIACELIQTQWMYYAFLAVA